MGCDSCSCSSNVDDILIKLLSTTYVLLIKTQNVHWHIEGASFGYIHTLTEAHYNNLFVAIDEIAERLRMLGYKAPATLSEYIKNSAISEELNANSEKDMIVALKNDHQTIISGLQYAVKMLEDDTSTVDLLTKRLQFHEKAAWIFNSCAK